MPFANPPFRSVTAITYPGCLHQLPFDCKVQAQIRYWEGGSFGDPIWWSYEDDPFLADFQVTNTMYFPIIGLAPWVLPILSENNIPSSYLPRCGEWYSYETGDPPETIEGGYEMRYRLHPTFYNKLPVVVQCYESLLNQEDPENPYYEDPTAQTIFTIPANSAWSDWVQGVTNAIFDDAVIYAGNYLNLAP